MLEIVVEEVKASTKNVPAEELFQEINVTGTKSNHDEVNQVKGGKHEATLEELKKEIEVVESSNAISNVGGLQKDIIWHKKISKSGKKGNQVWQFPTKMIKKALCPDITSCTLLDLQMYDDYECTIMKSNRQNVDMYIGKVWYSFSKHKNLGLEIN
ncbi:hypothetical protein RYX36_007295 [Vicia faba]